MDNFRDSRVVHGPKTQRNFPRALLVDHLHDRWAAWVMEALRCVYFFKRIRFFLLYIIYVYAYIYIYTDIKYINKCQYMTTMLNV